MSEYTQELKRDIFDTLSAKVNTQKTIHPAEQTALDYTAKKWQMLIFLRENDDVLVCIMQYQ